MKEKPILFSLPMVQAIMEGRKTQTRRIATNLRKPPCVTGDRSWVQEGYFLSDNVPETSIFLCNYEDGTTNTVILESKEHAKLLARKTPPTKKQPGRFMYKSCSRITLEVIDVYNERLQDISEEDAIAKGIQRYTFAVGQESMYKDYLGGSLFNSAKASYQSLWSLIHGTKSWDETPYVWVIKFRVFHGAGVEASAAAFA